MKRKFKYLAIILSIILILFCSLFMPSQSKAFTDVSNELARSLNNPVNLIKNQTFFIKNAYSGRYLDVYRGNVANGTNIQQYEFGGGDNQKWYVQYNENDGSFSFLSMLNTNYALDVYGAATTNGTNISLWSYHGGDSERFKLFYNGNLVFKIATKMTNYDKCLAVQNAGCSNEDNVFQYSYNGSWNDLWILEPASRSNNAEWLGIYYALANAENSTRVKAYPDCHDIGGNCTNFVSQCMLSQGIHFENGWYTYRKNGNYSAPTSVSELNNSWNLADPSPWISAPKFEDYWTQRKNTSVVKGSTILSTTNWYENCGFYRADVVQILSDGVLGIGRKATHSMYITGVGNNANNNTCFTVSYHSDDREDVNLLDIINPDKYYRFYAL